jgi:hypothetical protein
MEKTNAFLATLVLSASNALEGKINKSQKGQRISQVELNRPSVPSDDCIPRVSEEGRSRTMGPADQNKLVSVHLGLKLGPHLPGVQP